MRDERTYSTPPRQTVLYPELLTCRATRDSSNESSRIELPDNAEKSSLLFSATRAVTRPQRTLTA